MDEHICEYCDCCKEATVYDEELQAWLCEEHYYSVYNSTGFCSRDCMLGHGCDESC